MFKRSSFRILLTLGGTAALFALSGSPPAARPAPYWPLLCRAPLPQMVVEEGLMTLAARPGRIAARPRSGECVWLDRGVNRRGEVLPDGRMLIRLRINGGPRLVSRFGRVNMRIARDARARRIWRANRRGEVFQIGARRSGRGVYEAQHDPTAWPGGGGAWPPGWDDDDAAWRWPMAVRVVIDSVRVHEDGDDNSPGDWFMTLAAGRVGSADVDGRRWPARGTRNVRDGAVLHPRLSAVVRGLRPGDAIRVQVTATDCDGNGLFDLGAMLPGEAGDVFREMRRMMGASGCAGEELRELSNGQDSAGLSFTLPMRTWRRGGVFVKRIRGDGLDFTIRGHVERIR